ncbi:hypothetical protein K435DRAFT_748673 [Dendrothele bispora CBS 962.96]|uniref:Nudix hydrolase domain-containing protein n=1 Tax=Dendrothele bispora (strain CBS 962.96) TaxID=1314807 RepID=A0A4S8MJK0_DENBC|nr:hypothetical protein K435DRAFT_748673 [Dendrothele bispora CBS 962.96]
MTHVPDNLTEQTKLCLSRLTANGHDDTDISQYSRSAAVLVLLFERAGQLRVLLTTRSKHLRTHPGQTALPGGRKDATDKDFVETAFREANEEVSLPRHSPKIHMLGTLQPYISQWGIRVSPIVAFLSDNDVLDQLKPNPGEVDRIFDHPLEAILDPEIARSEELVLNGSEDWPYEQELYNNDDRIVPVLGNTMYRMHRFRSIASPVKGLTSDILINVAEIAYARSTTYERYAPGQIRGFSNITHLLNKGQAENLPAEKHLPSV